MSTVTRIDLIEAAYRESKLTRNQTTQIVEQFFSEISDALERGEDVLLSSFGSFAVRNKKERMARNPKTGAPAHVAPRRVVTFKPSPILKQKMNSKASGDKRSESDCGNVRETTSNLQSGNA